MVEIALGSKEAFENGSVGTMMRRVTADRVVNVAAKARRPAKPLTLREPHGGNALLRDLIARDPNYPSAFRFSLLQILPRTMAREEVIKREAVYKAKLGTRAKGLNLN